MTSGHDPHAHDQAHQHARGTPGAGARYVGHLTFAFAAVVLFFVAQLIVALATGSLALLSDSGHMLTDALGLGLALAAIVIAARSRQERSRTYGLYRLEVLAALVNAILLVAVAVYVVVEAIHRIGDDPDVPP